MPNYADSPMFICKCVQVDGATYQGPRFAPKYITTEMGGATGIEQLVTGLDYIWRCAGCGQRPVINPYFAWEEAA